MGEICPECGDEADIVDKIGNTRVFRHNTNTTGKLGVVDEEKKCYHETEC